MARSLQMFKALADPTRLRILRMLAVKPLCVCEVMSVLKMAQSTSSKHLRILEEAGFIESTPGGTWTIYRLGPQTPEARTIINIVQKDGSDKELKVDLKAVKNVDRNRLCKRPLKKKGKSI